MTAKDIRVGKATRVSVENPDSGVVVPANRSQHNRRKSDGFTISQMLLWCWSFRGVAAIVLIAGLLLTAAAVAAVAWKSTSQVYTYAIRFDFNGIEDGKYPNEQPFNLKDILAPKLVSDVYSSVVPRGSNITQQDFAEALTISSYTPSRRSIIDKYQKLLADRRLTFAERTELQSKLQEELNTAARRAAVLSFDNNDFGLDPTAVATTLRGIVDRWNRYSIETRGVLQLELASIDPRSIDLQSLENLPHVDRVRAISTVFKKVTELFDGLSEYSGARQLTDEESGATIDSAQRELGILSDQIVNLSRELPSSSGTGTRVLPKMLTAGAFDNEALRDTDLQIGFDIVQARLADIRTNINIISKFAAGDSVKDLQTGLTITDLENVISELEVYQIDPVRSSALELGLSEAPEDVRTYFEYRIREMERKKATIESVAGTLVTASERYEKSGFSPATGETTATQQSTAAPVFPQFGDGFLDRLIELSGRSEDAGFRQELARRSIDLLTEASEIQGNISALTEDLARFERGLSGSEAGNSPKIEEFRGRLDRLLDQLRNYMTVTQRIGARIQSSNEVISVLKETLGLRFNDPRISLLTFPSSAPVDANLLPSIIKELQDLVVTANKFREELAPSLYGAEALSVSVSSPERVASPLVTRETVLIFVLGFMLSLLLALFAPIAFAFSRREQ